MTKQKFPRVIGAETIAAAVQPPQLRHQARSASQSQSAAKLGLPELTTAVEATYRSATAEVTRRTRAAIGVLVYAGAEKYWYTDEQLAQEIGIYYLAESKKIIKDICRRIKQVDPSKYGYGFEETTKLPNQHHCTKGRRLKPISA